MRSGRVKAVSAAALALTAACGPGGRAATGAPSRSPRTADVEGVVTSVDFKHVSVDGVSYAVSPRLRSFAAGTLQTVPLLWRKGQYVQVGLSGRTASWIAGLGAVVSSPRHDPTVYFTEVLMRIDGGRAVFADGTTLRLDGAVLRPAHLPSRVRAEIDPRLHRVKVLGVESG